MLHNDISNTRSFVIGFRYENSLVSKQGLLKRIKINDEVFSLMNYIYYNTEYTVCLIINESTYTKRVQKIIMDYPINDVCVIVRRNSEITSRLLTGELTYYVSNDIVDLQSINSEYAVDTKKFNNILKREVKRFGI